MLILFIGITIRGKYCDDIRVVTKYPPSALIPHEVFLKSFDKIQFPHKSVNLFFILVIGKD